MPNDETKAAEVEAEVKRAEAEAKAKNEAAEAKAEADAKARAKARAAADAKSRANDGLIKMLRDDETVYVHPTTVTAHQNVGFRLAAKQED